MKKLTTALALVLGIGIAVNVAQEAAPSAETDSAGAANVPGMELHKDLERHRVDTAAAVSRHTVSVEIDYDRAPVESGPSFPGLPGFGPDMSNPFFRYDIGPFSGLVVGPNHILVSDRTLGNFSGTGAGESIVSITATLPNGERWPARVIGRHQEIDLALLRLRDRRDLNSMSSPESDVPLTRGQFIMVVGRGQNPLGTLVNDGIVSAVERVRGTAFQIDARIGNSTLGAPVVDKEGRLVGMVTLHDHRNFGQASGVSFAAYIGEVRDAYEVMKSGKFIERPPAPFMGVGANKKWTDKPGLEIGSVVADSGAERAGLRIGDVITHVNGKEMNEVNDLGRIIGEHEVGDTLDVTIIRSGKELVEKVTLGQR